MKLFVFYGLFLWLLMLEEIWRVWGQPCWVIQQIMIFLFAIGAFPFLRRLPVLGGVAEDIDHLRRFYQNNPDHLRASVLLYRHIPIVNFILLRREMTVMLQILIVGIPLDLAFSLVTEYVFNVPKWGLSDSMPFLLGFASEAGWTFVTTPYMVMIVMGLKWLVGREAVTDALPTSTQEKGRTEPGK